MHKRQINQIKARASTILRLVSGCVLLVLILASCRKRKESIATKEPLRGRTTAFLLRHYEDSKLNYEWLGMKVDADYITMGESQSFKATIRMRRDSAIWISITPLLGIEMIRMMVTADSVKYLSKIPDNKFYYVGTFNELNSKVGIEMDFDMLQDILIGNAIGLEKDEGRFRSEIEGENYLMISKYKRKVRRVVGIDDRKLENDTIVINPNNPKYQRTIRKMDEDDDLIISRYWLEPENYKLVKSVFNDLIRQRTMEVFYGNFEQNDGQTYPAKCKIVTISPKMQQELSFDITKLSEGKSYDFPFEIPDDFPRKDSL